MVTIFAAEDSGLAAVGEADGAGTGGGVLLT